jgi:hypothetical protein
MENHGINMIGNYFMESVSGPVAASANERRLIYNVSSSINGGPDVEGQYRLFYSGRNSGGSHKWLRPLVANDDDKPDADDDHILGSASYRWRAIYSKDFYGSVRYS